MVIKLDNLLTKALRVGQSCKTHNRGVARILEKGVLKRGGTRARSEQFWDRKPRPLIMTS